MTPDTLHTTLTALREALAEQAEQEPGFYGRAAARLSQRVKELELEQSGKWRDHVEHRMLTWKTSHMNESGDQLALKDFMDEHILNDLIDFVCDEYTAPVEPMRQEPVGRWNWNEAKFEWLTKFDYYKHHMTPLYTHPVRTKDLTDDEIAKITGHRKVGGTWPVAVLVGLSLVAADREKNK